VLAIAMFACSKPVWHEPATFAGVPLTETRDTIGKIYPLTECAPSQRGELSNTICKAQIPFGGAVRDAVLTFLPEGSDRLLSMSLRIGRADCESVEAELMRLYGKPQEHSAAGGGMRDRWRGTRMQMTLDLPPPDGPAELRVGLIGGIAFLRLMPRGSTKN
jgi:hypothetical protein